MEIANGKSAEMKAMARKIIAAQQKEIAQFDKWLASPQVGANAVAVRFASGATARG